MASLCESSHSLPPPVDLTYGPPLDHIHLYHLWKTASHTGRLGKTGISPRAENRLWRLLNEKLLCQRHRLASSSMALQEVPLPPKADKLSQTRAAEASNQHLDASEGLPSSRPSLFLKDLKPYALDSGDETSDLSEDDDDDDDDHDWKSYNGNLSPLHIPPETSRRQRLPQPSAGPCCSRYLELTLSQLDQLATRSLSPPKVTPPDPKKNIFFIENTPSPSARSSNDSRNSATFQSGGTGHTSATTHEISNSLQATTSSPTKETSSADEAKAELAPPLNALHAPFKRQDSLFSAQHLRRATPDDVSSVSSSELSEDEERDDLHELRIRQPSTVSKLSRSMKSDNESEWVSISSEDEKNGQGSPSKPLTFAKVIPVPVPLPKASTTDAADLSTETVKPSPLTKPRSLLSGLFLNSMGEQKGGSPTGNDHLLMAAPKPVLKRSSTTGVITIDKGNNNNAPSTKDKKQLLRPSIMFSKRYASFSDISKLSQRSPVLFVEEEESAGDSNAKDDSGHLFAKQTSSVGLLNFMVNANSTTNLNSITIGEDSMNKGSCENCENAISSSLSKYSNVPQGGSSLKNFLSKSSLSLTSLFGQGKTDRKSRPNGQRTFSNESLKASKDSVSDKSAVSGASAPLVEDSTENQESSAMSSSVGNHSRSVKTSSIPAKGFEPSVEVSGSLKDSLLIDHRLGKVPLPERVISDDDLFGGQERLVLDEDNDDYHSKGW